MCARFVLLLVGLLFCRAPFVCAVESAVRQKGFDFVKRSNSLEIYLDGSSIAIYVWNDPKTTRPHFKQIKAIDGKTQVTRNHPPQKGDFEDHGTYHPGIWWGFGDVGGNDYWRMKARIIGGEFLEEPTTTGDVASFAVRNQLLTNKGDTPSATRCVATDSYVDRMESSGFARARSCVKRVTFG